MRGLRTAAIVMSGSELLDGRVRDLNGIWLSTDLSRRGVIVRSVQTVADETPALLAALRHALAQEPDILVVSGGLGATHDDLTAAALSSVLGVPLEEDAVALAMVQDSLRAIAERRGATIAGLLDQARHQALLPAGTEPLAPAGVAPGISARHGRTRIVALPGVPHEFRSMWAAFAEGLAGEGWFPAAVTRTLRIYGCGEAAVAAVLESLPFDQVDVGITAGGGEVVVHLRYPADERAAGAQASALEAALGRALPVYDVEGRSVDAVLLAERGESLAVAESCTGGALGARIVSRPGSSAYFRGGVVAYANEVKQDLIGVPAELLARCGAVSREVAEAMADGARRACCATWSLSTTGVAGPEGGSEEKPVGLVYLGCAGPSRTVVVRERFPGDREAVRTAAVSRALHLLREELTGGGAV
jgi:nicotinamide-nucleotide amidase